MSETFSIKLCTSPDYKGCAECTAARLLWLRWCNPHKIKLNFLSFCLFACLRYVSDRVSGGNPAAAAGRSK